jgi:hypothetical protein
MYYMPAHSISINTPTNAKIRQIVQNLEQSYTPEPDRFIFGGGAVREYSQSGNNGSYPAPMEHTEGGGPSKKLRKVGKTLKQGAKAFNDVAAPVAKVVSTLAPLAPLLLALGEDIKPAVVKPKRIRVPKVEPKVGGGKSECGQIVKQIMKEKGMSLPQASKYVKEHGLYTK